MKPSFKMSRRVSAAAVRSLVSFRFPRLLPGRSGLTNTFHVHAPVNAGEVIVTQLPAAGSFAAPVIQYQIVDATSGRAITGVLTVSGARTVVLPFRIPPGTERLRIRNVGSQPAYVQGTIVLF